MKPGYPDVLLRELSELVLRFNLVRGAPGRDAVLVCCAVGLFALTVGLILSGRLLAPTSPGASLMIAVTLVALLIAADVVRFQFGPISSADSVALHVVAGALAVEIARRILDSKVAATVATLVVGCFFGGLIALLLGRAVQLANAF